MDQHEAGDPETDARIVDRRAVLRASAWGMPAIALAVAAPAAAASPTLVSHIRTWALVVRVGSGSYPGGGGLNGGLGQIGSGPWAGYTTSTAPGIRFGGFGSHNSATLEFWPDPANLTQRLVASDFFQSSQPVVTVSNSTETDPNAVYVLNIQSAPTNSDTGGTQGFVFANRPEISGDYLFTYQSQEPSQPPVDPVPTTFVTSFRLSRTGMAGQGTGTSELIAVPNPRVAPNSYLAAP